MSTNRFLASNVELKEYGLQEVSAFFRRSLITPDEKLG